MQGVFEFYREQPLRPARPERLFFGLVPDRETSRRMRQFGERFLGEKRLKARPLKAECLHISLHHVGDFRRLRAKFIYAAQKAAGAVTMPQFEVTFRSVRSFETGPAREGDERPLVLLGEGEALLALHKGLGAAMARIGLKAALDFTPHLTLWYGPDRIPAQPIEPIRFTVSEFALIHSELGFARHTIVDRWRLDG